MLVLVFASGTLPPVSILGFMAKSPSLRTPEERRFGCYYPLLAASAMGATLYAAADERRRRHVWRAVACLLSVLILVPAVEMWGLFFQSRTRLLPPLHGILWWLPAPVNLATLAITADLSRRERKWVAALSVLAFGVAAAVAIPVAWPTVERIRRQYPAARAISDLGGPAHVRWDRFWVTGIFAPETRIADGGVRFLDEFPRLQRLDLSWTSVGDIELERIGTLSELRDVRLGHTRAGDATLEGLCRLPRLSALRLESTPVSDAGAERLPQARRLYALSLDGTRVTGRGLASMSKMSWLGRLSLNETRIGDQDLPRLAGMESLEELQLRRTSITDAGLELLPHLPKLRTLEITGTQVTPEAVDRWKRRQAAVTGRECWVSFTDRSAKKLTSP
jgi:hypothetical protein